MALTKPIDEIIREDKFGLLAKHDSWSRVPLAEVASVLNGCAFDSTYFGTTEGLPLIRIRDVVSGSTDTFYSGPFDQRFLVKRGDLILGMDGDFNIARWRSAPGLLNQRVCKISVRDESYSGRFLEYALPGYLAAVNAATSSITVKHLSSRTVEDLPLPLPPRKEQERIAQTLDELLGDLDTGIAELEAARKKLARYRQSLLKAAVEGTLTADWRAERARRGDTFETGPQLLERIVRERRARWEEKQLAKFEAQGKAPPKGWQDEYPEPVQPGASELPLPSSWAAATIDQIARVGTGSTPLRSRAEYFQGGGIPWVTSGAVNDEEVTSASDFVTEAAVRACRLETYPPDTILVAMYGEGKTRGRSATLRIPATINQALAAVVLADEAKACKAMVNVCLQGMYEELREQASGGVQPNLNLQIVRSVEVRLPPLDEQSKIVELLSDQFDMIRMQGEAIDALLGLATAQRQNILRAAFSGQLVPQDPTDEPASALLARIRAERAKQASSAPKRRASARTSKAEPC